MSSYGQVVSCGDLQPWTQVQRVDSVVLVPGVLGNWEATTLRKVTNTERVDTTTEGDGEVNDDRTVVLQMDPAARGALCYSELRVRVVGLDEAGCPAQANFVVQVTSIPTQIQPMLSCRELQEDEAACRQVFQEGGWYKVGSGWRCRDACEFLPHENTFMYMHQHAKPPCVIVFSHR